MIDPSVSVGAPRFLNSLADQYRMEVDGQPVEQVWTVSPVEAARYVDLLESPTRHLPVVAVTRPSGGNPPIVPQNLARRLSRDRTRRRCRATYDVRRVGPDHPDQECVWRCHQVVLAGLQPRLASVPSPTVHVSRPARRNRSIRRQPGCAPRASSWIRFWTSCSGDRSPSRSHSPRGRRGTRTPRGTASRCKGGSRRPHRRGVRGLRSRSSTSSRRRSASPTTASIRGSTGGERRNERQTLPSVRRGQRSLRITRTRQSSQPLRTGSRPQFARQSRSRRPAAPTWSSRSRPMRVQARASTAVPSRFSVTSAFCRRLRIVGQPIR